MTGSNKWQLSGEIRPLGKLKLCNYICRPQTSGYIPVLGLSRTAFQSVGSVLGIRTVIGMKMNNQEPAALVKKRAYCTQSLSCHLLNVLQLADQAQPSANVYPETMYCICPQDRPSKEVDLLDTISGWRQQTAVRVHRTKLRHIPLDRNIIIGALRTSYLIYGLFLLEASTFDRSFKVWHPRCVSTIM